MVESSQWCQTLRCQLKFTRPWRVSWFANNVQQSPADLFTVCVFHRRVRRCQLVERFPAAQLLQGILEFLHADPEKCVNSGGET